MPAVIEHEALLMDWKGERLKELRSLRGWTQADLAEISGIDQSKISRWEQNKYKPGVEDIFRLADALKVSCEAFRQPVGSAPIRMRFRPEEQSGEAEAAD